MAEELKFSAEFGGKTAHVIFSKSGSNYNVRTWGLKYREIAEILAIPVGTVKSRLHAALVRLHEAWASTTPLHEWGQIAQD